MTHRTTSGGGLFMGLSYREAADLVDSSPGASAQLRQRLSEDQQRDLLVSFDDAKLLCALQRLRVDAMLAGKHRAGR